MTLFKLRTLVRRLWKVVMANQNFNQFNFKYTMQNLNTTVTNVVDKITRMKEGSFRSEVFSMEVDTPWSTNESIMEIDDIQLDVMVMEVDDIHSNAVFMEIDEPWLEGESMEEDDPWLSGESMEVDN